MLSFQVGRRRGSDGVTVVMDFLLANARLVLGVGGAALLGIATLAVKRLIERAGRAAEEEKVEQKMAESWEELSKKSLEGVVVQHVAKARENKKTRKADLCEPTEESPALPEKRGRTLQELLLQFYHSRAALSPPEVQRAQCRALDICTEIQGFLRARHPDMPLGEMSLGGSLLDDLQVVSADHACLLVPLELEPDLWRLIPGEETLLTHPLHWMVRRLNVEYFPRGRSYWDRHLVGGYLSAESVVNMLSKVLMETINWPSISSTLDCLVRPVLGGPRLELEIRCPNEADDVAADCPLFISILPLLREGDVVLSAQPELTSPWVNAWHLPLYPRETQLLARLDSQDLGCRRMTLKLLKAAFRLNPALRPLDSAALANLLLRLSRRQEDWSRDSLHLRFRQCITEMIGHLEAGVLSSYFKPVVNLLSGLTDEQVDRMGFMLYCAVSEPEILLI
ncbi:mitochondrial dynamics protein MID49 isoform X2 [Syngnathoides biaculeatus]|nr:mitochondrial dynamics protein MID49 isoform X2 [Syngnathoides biaculeatus]XP_061686890.1 mitochondrial dynamics protein MID49 isoform X2 [Syngnathoides biaculeatus]XP_061686892.1 mitochondrial dynamics protein MID49 isoform X2 [Syngnathoides biaculeatus]